MEKSKYRKLSNQELTDRLIALEEKQSSEWAWGLLIIAMLFGDFGKSKDKESK